MSDSAITQCGDYEFVFDPMHRTSFEAENDDESVVWLRIKGTDVELKIVVAHAFRSVIVNAYLDSMVLGEHPMDKPGRHLAVKYTKVESD